MSGDALKLCNAIIELGIAEDQRAAAREARQGSGRSAQRSAESAAQKLESLRSQCASCQGASQCMSDSLDGPLSLRLLVVPGSGIHEHVGIEKGLNAHAALLGSSSADRFGPSIAR